MKTCRIKRAASETSLAHCPDSSQHGRRARNKMKGIQSNLKIQAILIKKTRVLKTSARCFPHRKINLAPQPRERWIESRSQRTKPKDHFAHFIRSDPSAEWALVFHEARQQEKVRPSAGRDDDRVATHRSALFYLLSFVGRLMLSAPSPPAAVPNGKRYAQKRQ